MSAEVQENVIAEGETQVSRNQLYKRSGSKESYKVWLEKAKAPGGLFDQVKAKGVQVIGSTATANESKSAPSSGGDPNERELRILGMKLWVAIPVIVGITGLLIWGAVKIFSKKKAA